MPVLELQKYENPLQAEDLKHRLVIEWRNPKAENKQPVIVIDKRGLRSSTHLYVVWDEWTGVRPMERSEIIMDAYRELNDPSKELDVSIAMGLTTLEADRMQIPYK